MTPDDTGLASRLRAAHAVGDRAIARALELEAEVERLTGLLSGIVYQAGGRLTVTQEAVECGVRMGLIFNDSSTQGDRATRLDLGWGTKHEGQQ